MDIKEFIITFYPEIFSLMLEDWHEIPLMALQTFKMESYCGNKTDGILKNPQLSDREKADKISAVCFG